MSNYMCITGNTDVTITQNVLDAIAELQESPKSVLEPIDRLIREKVKELIEGEPSMNIIQQLRDLTDIRYYISTIADPG